MVAAGALVGMDAVSWPQVLLSRPLVAATIGGALGGDPAAGLAVGAVLELFTLRFPPYGAASYPDTGPAALMAGAAFGGLETGTVPGILAAILCGWAAGWLGAASVRFRRRLNEHLVGRGFRPGRAGRDLERRHRLALALDGIRGALLTAAFAVPIWVVVRIADSVSLSAAGVMLSAGLIAAAVVLSGGAAARGATVGIRGWPLFVGGLAGGLLLSAWI